MPILYSSKLKAPPKQAPAVVSKYIRWMDRDNARAGIPNRTAQGMMGFLLLLFPFISINAYRALWEGHSLVDKVSTGAIRDGHVVLRPIGALIASTFAPFCLGIIMIAAAALLRSRDRKS